MKHMWLNVRIDQDYIECILGYTALQYITFVIKKLVQNLKKSKSTRMYVHAISSKPQNPPF